MKLNMAKIVYLKISSYFPAATGLRFKSYDFAAAFDAFGSMKWAYRLIATTDYD